MRVCVQYTQLTAPQYQLIDMDATGQAARAYRNLPKKPRPTIASKLDNTDGWVFAVSCQGVIVSSDDAYAVVPRGGAGGGVRILAWSDQVSSETGDPWDYPFRRGKVWDFPPLVSANVPGGLNTDQRVTLYAEAGAGWDYWSQLYTPAGTVLAGGSVVQWADWSTFPFPAEQDTKYGIWIRAESMPVGTVNPDAAAAALYDAHAAIQPPLKAFDV